MTEARARQDFIINGRFLTQPITGVQRVARELTKAIDRLIGERNFPVNIRLFCETHADLTTLPLANIPIKVIEGPRGARWEQTSLPHAIGSSELLCFGNTAPMWLLAVRHPVTVMIHDLSYRYYPSAYSRSYRAAHALMLPLILRRARLILTVSETEKASLCSLDPWIAPRVIAVQNGGWSDAVTVRNSPAHDPTFGKDYLLYVGSLSQRKNISGLVDTAVHFARHYQQSFLFVGSGSSILTESKIALPDDVLPYVRFAGHVDDLQLLAEIYRNAKCLVFPSFYEASPLPPLEAMQFGCPVVASNIPSMRERCADSVEYCDPHDVADIIRAIRRVLEQPGRVEMLIEQGYRQASEFSWHAQAEQVLAALVANDRMPPS